jgi:hypothetical protein
MPSLKLRRHRDHFPPGGPRWGDDQYVLLDGEEVVGVVQKIGVASGDAWQWSITKIERRPRGEMLSGVVPTKDEATKAFAEAWRKWFAPDA